MEFHYAGMPDGVWTRIGRAPNHVATLRSIPDEGTVVIEGSHRAPAFAGFPAGHPPMGAFLGTALKVRGEVFGYLYLADKQGGVTPNDVDAVLALAAAASVAIDNAQLYERAVSRERWLESSQHITTALLTDPGDEETFSASSTRQWFLRLRSTPHSCCPALATRGSWSSRPGHARGSAWPRVAGNRLRDHGDPFG